MPEIGERVAWRDLAGEEGLAGDRGLDTPSEVGVDDETIARALGFTPRASAVVAADGRVYSPRELLEAARVLLSRGPLDHFQVAHEARRRRALASRDRGDP